MANQCIDSVFVGEWPEHKCRRCKQRMTPATCYIFTIGEDGTYFFNGPIQELCRELKKGDKLTICQGVVVND